MDICNSAELGRIVQVVKSTYMPYVLDTREKPENTSVKGRKTHFNVFQRSRVIPKEYLGLPAKGHNWDILHVTGLQSCVI
jgi:hypothetical protein